MEGHHLHPAGRLGAGVVLRARSFVVVVVVVVDLWLHEARLRIQKPLGQHVEELADEREPLPAHAGLAVGAARVRRVDLTTNTVTTLAGKGGSGCADGDGAEATFAPVGLGLGRDGTVYVADYSNHRIRAISAATDGSDGEKGQ